MKKFLILACCVSLSACMDGGDHEDLRQWMEESSRGLKGKIQPLPEVRSYEPVAYDTSSLVDPFQSSRAIPEQAKSSGNERLERERERQREPLEAYPLESLKYVGVMTREEDKSSYAIIQADASLYQVKPGNYLGQNFGVITQISESEVVLKELVQDGAGDWIERVSSLMLQGQEGMK
ncbi:MAG: pilus assembly protein PilP [Candidatus Accumulibacter sp.]|jgi:type IV pilus assembly protein PilP|nr:pilus assembly protein PilP [Accumulibacter sp.]